MARLLTGDNGQLRPFREWVKLAEPISDHHNRVWLRTEYDTAVRRAAQARDWMQFREERDALPNLRWVPSTAVTPGTDTLTSSAFMRNITRIVCELIPRFTRKKHIFATKNFSQTLCGYTKDFACAAL